MSEEAPAPEPLDEYERDTGAPEEVDLMALLLPEGRLPACLDKLTLQYSVALLNGWVKQRSPACAAASVAGSWNALLNLKRSDAGAHSQDSVVSLFAQNLRDSAAKVRARIERILGAPIDDIDAALRSRLEAIGKSLGGRHKEKESKVGRRARRHAPLSHSHGAADTVQSARYYKYVLLQPHGR